MSKLSHTFHYQDEADFVTQMKELVGKLDKMESYGDVRARYPHLDTEAFSMRISRFKGTFPCARYGRRMTELTVTPELHRYLSRPLSQGRRDLQA
jgi:hypothetical protein